MPRKFVPGSILLACTLAAPLFAAPIVAPNSAATADGNSNNVYPFSPGWFQDAPTNRYQQVYAANQFGSPGSTIDIGAIAFRLDGADGGGQFTATYPSIQIDLSETSLGPDQLSSTFANNIGANDSTVYNGSLTVSPSGGSNPNPFNFVINLQTPFAYNNAQGNLLLDIRINQPVSTPVPALDAVFTTGDGVSRVWSPDTGSVNSVTGNVDTMGLVTEFLPTQAAPEPAEFSLCGFGFALLAFARWNLVKRIRRAPRS